MQLPLLLLLTGSFAGCAFLGAVRTDEPLAESRRAAEASAAQVRAQARLANVMSAQLAAANELMGSDGDALERALSRFVTGSRGIRQREGGRRGMPALQVARWYRLLDTVEQASATPQETSELVRLRFTLEVELELDVRAFGEVPPLLHARVSGAAEQLAETLSAQRKARLAQRLIEEARRRLVWPVEPVAVTSPFGRRVHPVTRSKVRHLGIDLAAAKGQAVHAAADGEVVYARWRGAHGRHVMLRHADGVITRYSHLSAILVRRGDTLKRGDALGLAGATGRVTGPHLHFEVWRNGRPVDPMDIVDALGPGKAVATRPDGGHAHRGSPARKRARRETRPSSDSTSGSSRASP